MEEQNVTIYMYVAIWMAVIRICEHVHPVKLTDIQPWLFLWNVLALTLRIWLILIPTTLTKIPCRHIWNLFTGNQNEFNVQYPSLLAKVTKSRFPNMSSPCSTMMTQHVLATNNTYRWESDLPILAVLYYPAFDFFCSNMHGDSKVELVPSNQWLS